MRYASCPMSQTAATLHEFTFTVVNYNYRPLSRRDTQLNNHYKLYMKSSKDHQSKIDFFLSEDFFAVIKLAIYA